MNQLLVMVLAYGANSLAIQHLHIHQLSKFDTMFEFTLTNQHMIDFSEIISEQSFFSRSILENLHVKAGVRQVYVSVTAGRMKNDEVEAPQHGTMIISNADVQQHLMVNQLSEIFRIAQTNVQSDPSYYYRVQKPHSEYQPLGFRQPIRFDSDELLFAQDPTDFICVDGIEALKQYLGCNGKKGLFALIDQNTIFLASYLTVQGFFEYDAVSRQAKQQISIVAVIPPSQVSNVFKGQSVKYCPIYSKALVSHQGRSSIYNLQEAQTLPVTLLQAHSEDFGLKIGQPVKKVLSRNYIGKEWWAFQSQYNVWVQALEDGHVEMHLYFPNIYIPLYSSLVVRAEDSQGNLIELKQDIQLEFSEEFKKIIVRASISSFQYVFCSIKFNKKLRHFENYPHDPERGFDLITTPIYFRGVNETSNVMYLSQNHITRLPLPDFSMPFNILTYSCITLGYYFLCTFRLSVERFEVIGTRKGSMVQRFIGFILSQIK